MFSFVCGIILLVAGYFTYGKVVEKILGPDDRQTPAITQNDGVDFMVLPGWKAMLIQLLNIAGIGPVIGVIIGIKFGAVVFWIIPIGNLIGGAVHDLVSGFMSMRSGGANLAELIRRSCGRYVYGVFSAFMSFLLLLVVAVFINVPAKIVSSGFFPESNHAFWIAVGVIFIYYIVATLFPIDKIIGRFYPIFGALLILGSFAIMFKLVIDAIADPALLQESAGFKAHMFTSANNHPILPLLFVTIACGIISGFHATQSPIIARTLKSEKLVRPCFYGMMVLEGIIAMIWAAAGLAIYNLFNDLMAKNPNFVLTEITRHFLGGKVGSITLLSVIILAVTSGDTAMRSLRLTLAEMFHLSQKKALMRILLCLPLVLLVGGLLFWSNSGSQAFGKLWNYFAWGNQVLSAITLMGGTVYLCSLKKPCIFTLLPGMFMTFIVVSYITWTSEAHSGPAGFGMELDQSYIVGIAIAVAAAILAIWQGLRKRKLGDPDWIAKGE